MILKLMPSSFSEPSEHRMPQQRPRYQRVSKKFSKLFTSKSPALKREAPDNNLNGKDTKLSQLELLPFELLLQITYFLKPVDYLCFTSTDRHLRTSLPGIPPSSLTECQQWLLTCRFERDILFPAALSASSPCTFLRDLPPRPTLPKQVKHLACAFCKRRNPIADFTGLSFGNFCHTLMTLQLKPWFFGDPGRLEAYPEARICGYHAPETLWMPKPYEHLVTNSRGENRYWEKWMDHTCMHCGACVSYFDRRETGCRACECETCPRMLTPCYQRYGPKSRMDRADMGDEEEIAMREGNVGDEIPGGPKIRGFLRTRGGKLCILEAGGLIPYVVDDAQTYREAEARAGLRPEDHDDEDDEEDEDHEDHENDEDAGDAEEAVDVEHIIHED